MGEVYRARDTKLKRDVALKVLPDAFAGDADRMARFQREAEVLASLNHPHIAAIYGIEERAIVMELVEGGPRAGAWTGCSASNAKTWAGSARPPGEHSPPICSASSRPADRFRRAVGDPQPASLVWPCAWMLNNVIEQDHRTVRKRVWLAKGYGSFQQVRKAHRRARRTGPQSSSLKSPHRGPFHSVKRLDRVLYP